MGVRFCHLSAEPLAEYVETVRVKTEGNLITLAEYFGVSVRHLNRYFGLSEDGNIFAKTPTIPLKFADEMLTHAGDETLHNLWDFDELDRDYAGDTQYHPKCKRCKIDLQKRRKLCGFCIEETTGRVLTYRQREIY